MEFANFKEVPKNKELIVPVYAALKELGSETKKDQLVMKVAEILNLSDELVNLPHNEKGGTTEFRYQINWAINYLSVYGAIVAEKPGSGVWKIADEFLNVPAEDLNVENIVKATGTKSKHNAEDRIAADYENAAQYVSEYIETTNYSFEYSNDAIEGFYSDFQKKYAPEILDKMTGEELLKYVFLSADSAKANMCYELEFKPEYKACFGNISGGSSYSYGLFKSEEKGTWVSGTNHNPKEISEQEAAVLAKEICSKLVEGAETIRNFELGYASDYDLLQKCLEDVIEPYASRIWVHKYYHMIFPDKFSVIHNDNMQKYMLCSLGIEPSSTLYGRSGQLTKIRKMSGFNAPVFEHAAAQKYGWHRYVFVADAENKKILDEWKATGIVTLPYKEIGSISDYKVKKQDFDKEKLKLKIAELVPSLSKSELGRWADGYIDFCKAEDGHIVVARLDKDLILIGTIIGDSYNYDTDNKIGCHTVKVNWIVDCPADTKLQVEEKEGVFYTVRNNKNLKYILQMLNGIKTVDKEIKEKVNRKMKNNSIKYPLNQILYGPPGTGKTYNVVKMAVDICDHDSENEKPSDYKAYLARYNELTDLGRIIFMTFHQSLGYEEFIEGIKPLPADEENDTKDVKYDVVPGKFKLFCEAARAIPEEEDSTLSLLSQYGIRPDAKVWKISLMGTYDNEVRKECLENGHVRIGWGKGERIYERFANKVKKGDIFISCWSANEFDAIGVVTSDVYDGNYEKTSDGNPYTATRDVTWISKKIHDIKPLNGDVSFTLSTIYKLWRVKVADILDIVEKDKGNVLTSKKTPKLEPYVFIIDEINRGNISKIFGELITLIEEPKREGADEAMSAILPYSPEPFSVPNNIYILGTMNTADRSIALLDTALRRRFEFVEMMPDSNVLEGIVIDGINVKDMLESINSRIEFFYDREHTIGHAYFTKLLTKENQKLENLAEIFKNKVIPLLQEYFYDDYEKIYYILGDNAKPEDKFRFVLEETKKVDKVFMGSGLDQVKTFGRRNDHVKYVLNKGDKTDSPYLHAESYKGIYMEVVSVSVEE